LTIIGSHSVVISGARVQPGDEVAVDIMGVYILINVVRKRTRLGNIEFVTGRVGHSTPVRCETVNIYVSGRIGNGCSGRG
jgi:hypothetical protein